MNAGLSIADVMRSATTHPARALGMENQLGKIAVNYRADALLLTTHPLQKAPWQQTPNAILADGRWYDKQAHQQLLQAATQHDSFWLTLGRFLQHD